MKTLSLAWLAAAHLSLAADLTGNWIAQVSGAGDPLYFRVTLNAVGSKITGTWNDSKIEGSTSGDRITLAFPRGNLTGSIKEMAGEGQVGLRRRADTPLEMQAITWKLTRLPDPPAGGPKTWDFVPKEFHRYYSATIPPVLHVFPGDTIRTSTVDSGGLDAKLEHRSPGGNPETGPFYIEGALPGDTLVVKLKKVKLNRDTARSGARINGRTVTPAFVAAAKYADSFDSEWKLDAAKGIAMLAHPTERMKNYKVPILTMIGCLATAPAGNLSYRSGDLGPYGGNMDYNQMGEGVTLYLPVFHPGALFFLGDGHAAMGDGELTGGALETSLDVEFSVDIVKDFATAGPRLENSEYVMSMGIAGSVPDSIQLATAQLAAWLKGLYHLNDNEMALLLGTVLKYDITEMVDSQFNVVAKVPKSALKAFE